MIRDQREADILAGRCPECGFPKGSGCHCDRRSPEPPVPAGVRHDYDPGMKHYHECHHCGVLSECCDPRCVVSAWNDKDWTVNGTIPDTAGCCLGCHTHEPARYAVNRGVTDEGLLVTLPLTPPSPF